MAGLRCSGETRSANAETGVSAAGYRRLLTPYPGEGLYRVFTDETVDPRRDNGQRYRAELEHGIVERADVEFETRSFPNLLSATLATLPSMLLIPSAPFDPSVFSPITTSW